MESQPTLARRLLAGSVGPERQPVRPDPSEPRWYEALHVRDPRAARERLARQVSAGADIVVAPTWQTHRRALLAVGETRQARAWTAAAVRIGRDAIELGLERRDSAPSEIEDDREGPGTDAEPVLAGAAVPPGLRPMPLLAASLPALDVAPEPGMGRLLPREAASERDYRDQVGLLAEAAPDLLLVEGQATIAEARLAVETALDAGLPVWAALNDAAGEDALARFIDALGDLAVDGLLLPGVPPSRLPQLPITWGCLVSESAPGSTAGSNASAWLDAGATIIGLLDAATPGRLATLRATIDEVEAATLRAARGADERWWAHVRRAAAMAEGGPALWLHAPGEPVPSRELLPDGFEWLVVPADEASRLPDGRFRLIASTLAGPDTVLGSGRSLAGGGVLAVLGDPRPVRAEGLRVIVLDEAGSPTLAILRREP